MVQVVILFPLVKSIVTVLTLFVGTQTCRHTILLYLCVATDHLVWFLFQCSVCFVNPGDLCQLNVNVPTSNHTPCPVCSDDGVSVGKF